MHTTAEHDHPSPTVEDYLKTILALDAEAGGLVRPAAIADAMGVTRPTVTATLRRLADAGWVERSGRGVRLTSEGREHARSVARRRDIAEAFLERMLGFPRDVAMAEACTLEHALSARAADALARRLGL